jgi:hypothetical protein
MVLSAANHTEAERCVGSNNGIDLIERRNFVSGDEKGRHEQYLDDLACLGRLQDENKQLRDEIDKLKPLARLATVMSLMEGENQKLHEKVTRDDREFEKAWIDHCSLRSRVYKLEKLVAEITGNKS